MSDLTPITRQEMYLNALSDSSQTLPEPITREEMFLKKAAEGGGGGGSSLPDVTSSDNGKILKVINGSWGKGDRPIDSMSAYIFWMSLRTFLIRTLSFLLKEKWIEAHV